MKITLICHGWRQGYTTWQRQWAQAHNYTSEINGKPAY